MHTENGSKSPTSCNHASSHGFSVASGASNPCNSEEKTIWLTMMDKVLSKSNGLTPILRRVMMIVITPSKMTIAFMPPSLPWKTKGPQRMNAPPSPSAALHRKSHQQKIRLSVIKIPGIDSDHGLNKFQSSQSCVTVDPLFKK